MAQNERNWDSRHMTRQRENEEYEPRQLDYDTGLEMESAVRKNKKAVKGGSQYPWGTGLSYEKEYLY